MAIHRRVYQGPSPVEVTFKSSYDFVVDFAARLSAVAADNKASSNNSAKVNVRADAEGFVNYCEAQHRLNDLQGFFFFELAAEPG